MNMACAYTYKDLKCSGPDCSTQQENSLSQSTSHLTQLNTKVKWFVISIVGRKIQYKLLKNTKI